MWFLLEKIHELLWSTAELLYNLVVGLWSYVQQMPDDLRLIGSSLLLTIFILLLFLLVQLIREHCGCLCGRPTNDSIIDSDEENDDSE